MQLEKFHIRLIEKQDAEKFYDLIERNRTRLEDFFAGTVAKTSSLEKTKTYVDEILEKQIRPTYLAYLVIDIETGAIVTLIDVKNIDWNLPKAELGCFVDATYEGKGISGRALKIIIDQLFEEFNFEKLFLRTHVENKPARALAEKCGFEIEGTLRRDYKTTAGELVDLLYYGLLRP